MTNDHWPEVPIPEGSTIYKDRVVYPFGHIYSETQGRRISNRKSIGTPCEDGKMMRPNQTYIRHFSDLFQTQTGMLPLQEHISIGLYAAVLVIVENNGLKSCLEKAFGEERTNRILDVAMYAISCHSNVSEQYSVKMEHNHVFSDRTDKDSWPTFFEQKIGKKEIDRFKELWALECVENGINSGFVSWTGLKNDCDCKGVEEADPGKAKSGKGDNPYGCVYCVAQDGTPITFGVHEEAPDHAAIQKFVQALRNMGILIPGAIIDGEPDDLKCLQDVLTIVDDYVVRLKEDTIGFKNAVKDKGEEVRNFKSSLRIPNERLFGDSIRSVLFDKHDSEEWVHLFFDCQNGGERAYALLDEIEGTVEDIKKKTKDYIAYENQWEKDEASSKEEKKPFSVTIPTKLKNYLTVKGTTPYDIEVVKNEDAINRELWGKGLYALGTHSEMSAAQANRLYKLRDVIEKFVDIIQSLLGFDPIPAKSPVAVESRLFIAFVAAILYTELAKASREVAGERHSTSPKYDTPVVIDQLLSVVMIPLSNGTYGLQYKSIPEVMPIFRKLNAEKDILDTVVEKYNLERQKKKSNTDSSEKSDDRSEESAGEEEPKPPKRPRGRPPKKKEATEEKPRRPRGRPPKPRDPTEEQKPKRPRGRPPKPQNIEPDKPRRPRGRPRKHGA